MFRVFCPSKVSPKPSKPERPTHITSIVRSFTCDPILEGCCDPLRAIADKNACHGPSNMQYLSGKLPLYHRPHRVPHTPLTLPLPSSITLHELSGFTGHHRLRCLLGIVEVLPPILPILSAGQYSWSSFTLMALWCV